MNEAVQSASAPTDAALEPGSVLVSERSADGYTQDLFDGRHRLLADEPLSAGGSDLGPGPYELLLLALGSCTSMTIRLYARRRQWPLDHVNVRLRHYRDYAKDCVDCDTSEVLLDHIDREIELQGNLSAEQIAKLMEIADKCPVHRTLSRPIRIATRLRGG